MSWYLFSILSVFGLAAAELAQQRLLNVKDPLSERASAVFTFLFQSLLTLPIVFFYYRHGEIWEVFGPDIIYRLLIVTMVASIAMVFYLRSFKVRNISFSAIFISGSVVITTTMGIIFFDEGIYATKFVGIALVLLAIILLNWRNSSLEKNHYYGLLAGALFGVTYVLDKSIVGKIEPLVYIFWAFFLVAFFGFLMNPKGVIDSVRGKTLRAFKPVVFSGLGYFFYNLFTFYAYRQGGEVGKVDAINNTQVFLIILFEILILKRTRSIALKIITACLAVAGVVILGLR